MLQELRSYYKNTLYEAGCDEAGRGCLAGPVFAAAVIIHPDKTIAGLQDSKKLSIGERERLRKEIEINALDYAVASVDEEEIDQINILQASLKAMFKALSQLRHPVQHVLVDGNKIIPQLSIPQTAIVRGDSLYQSIAAASILAKTYRDEFMLKIASEHPEYHWDRNKGYPSMLHRRAIVQYGWSKYHRKTFRIKNPPNLLFD